MRKRSARRPLDHNVGYRFRGHDSVNTSHSTLFRPRDHGRIHRLGTEH